MTHKNMLMAATIGAALLASTAAFAQEKFIQGTAGITSAYRCYHLAVASRAPEAESLLRLGDYSAMSRGLDADEKGQLKGYARALSEQAEREFGGAAQAFDTLGCRVVARSRIVGENPNQRIPPTVIWKRTPYEYNVQVR